MDIVSIYKNKEKRQESFSHEEKQAQIISELKELLKNYLAKNPNITANAFCLKNNLSSSTVNNLLTGVTKKYVSSEVARKIVCGVNRGETIGYILRNTEGVLGEFLRRKYASLVNVEIEGTYPENIERTLNTRNARLVMMLAHNKRGTTRKEISENLDKFALDSLEKMLSEGVLHEDEKGIITGKSPHIYLNNEITKELIQEVNYFLKPCEENDSQVKILWGRLSDKKRKKQKEILLEAIEKIRELYKEEDLDGEPTFVTITADTLSQPKNNKGKLK